MGLFGPSKAELAAMEADVFIFGGGGGETKRAGRHRGGNQHGSPKAKPTGKHGKTSAKPAKGGKK